MYDYVILTHLPAFYKINLYNELAKKLNIYVIFLGNSTNEKRAKDFTNLNNLNFKYEIIYNGNFQDRNKIKSCLRLYQIISKIKFNKILLGGWELLESWLVIFITNKNKNCYVLESTIIESITTGWKGLIKKIFLSKISTVFASGNLHIKLMHKLNFDKTIKITRGVGIINKPIYEDIRKIYKKRFLFIGRLSDEKNLETLIYIFNDLPSFTLTIVGIGPNEIKLKKIAKNNIIFTGSINNSEIQNIFLKNDIFILPSIHEPWGLVVEEALYFGLPVIVSNNCGACELIENGINGFLINPYDLDEMKKIILNINEDIFLKLVKNIKENNIDIKDLKQVAIYD